MFVRGIFLLSFLSSNVLWASFFNQLSPAISDVSCSHSDKQFCDIVETKSWSFEEKIFIENEIARLQNKGLAHLLVRALQNGTLHFVRSTYGFSLDIFPDRPIKREKHQFAVTDQTRGWIIFFDLFFNHPIKIDPITDTELKSHTFLHELIHAYDKDHKISLNIDFLRIAGFQKDTFRPDFIKNTITEREAIIEDIIGHRQNQRELEAFTLEREYGMSYGLPRLYSMTSPHEALADLASHIFYDKNHSRYIDPKLIEYVDTHILRNARNF